MNRRDGVAALQVNEISKVSYDIIESLDSALRHMLG